MKNKIPIGVTMKINYLETESSPIGFLARDSLSGVAELVKGLITRDHVTEQKLSYWQLVFLKSKARIFPISIGSGPRTPGFRNT